MGLTTSEMAPSTTPAESAVGTTGAPSAAKATKALIGIHLTAGEQDLAATMRALYGTTTLPFELAVLVDPASGEVGRVTNLIDALPAESRWWTPAPGGGAASFNRLIAEDSDVYVFLEAGALPCPQWLERMMAALDADSTHGLAGPTTDRCWNEQAAHAIGAPGGTRQCSPSPLDITREARAVRDRFGESWRSMAPLYSLSDFCLVVRRAVVDAIGAADMAYGRGPCWEMDYAVRAARGGFRSIWAKSALVLRGAWPVSRQVAETALLDINKRVYQDRFCGWRARAGAGAPYHSHCRGEECADFAQPDKIRITLPRPHGPAARSAPALPLITCIMPTRGRLRFVRRAIEYFERQDYPNRELIIVGDDARDFPDDIQGMSVRTMQMRATIGAKRQAAVSAAHGQIIAHWDDDDWYSPTRLSRQVRPILDGVADITGLNDVLFMLLAAGEIWSVTPELFARMFVENVSGGTLMFRRDVWRRSGPYPDTSMREDCDFMVKAMSDGARLCPVSGQNLCVYVRHPNTTWKFDVGRFLDPIGWKRVPEPAFLARDRAFYAGLIDAVQPVSPRLSESGTRSDGPLISCIMPTADRREFVAQALAQFLTQDYPHRELIIVDDGGDSVADLIPREEKIRYLRLDRRSALGTKRNIACEIARGDLIAHWDDDDWRAPEWLSSQVQTHINDSADLCGLNKVLFYAPASGLGWRYVYDGARPWLCGGTLCYTKTFWARAPFRAVNVGEDNDFIWSRQPKRLSVNASDHLYVATIHRGNVSPKHTTGHRWHPLPANRLQAMIRAIEGTRRQAS